MSRITDFPARGKVTSVDSDSLIFTPGNTTYELQLQTSTRYQGPVGELINGLVRGKARKIYTVPSGGGFVAPIFGPPRTAQGRVLFADDSYLVIRAGFPFIIELPKEDSAIDLDQGPITVGTLINAVIFPGVSFEPMSAAVAQRT
jgi:hypothetical protein